ncbi:MAG: TIGR02206 family membrane protein [Phycisphaerales bacterium]|nr:TIGR02206 family membrane protein [Phycisphaerales bacterium]
MQAPEFVRYGLSHASALAATLGGAWLLRSLILSAAERRAARTAARMLLLLASIAILLSEIAGQIWRIRTGIWNIKTDLPLHLCDIAGIAVIWTALARAAWLARSLGPLTIRAGELAYFWTLAGSSQALLTPDLAMDFPHVAFLDFFVSHGTAWSAILGLAVSGRLRVRRGAFLPCWLITLAVGALVGLINIPLHANYMYTCGPPGQASVYDYFGPWPLSLVTLAAVGLLLFWLCERLYFAICPRVARIPPAASAQSE